MNKLMLFILTSFLVCFSSFTESSIQNKSSGIEIHINEKNTPKITLLSALLRPPKVIILEDSEKCLFGNLTEMQVSDGLIFILDAFVAKALFVFDIEGKFIRQIGTKGGGPGEYTTIIDFTIDKERKELYMLTDQRIHIYKFDGTFVKTLNFHSLNRWLYKIQYYDGHIYADATGDPLAENNEMLIKIDASDGKIIERYFKSTEYNYGWDLHYSTGDSSFKSRLNDPPMYAQTFMNQIISLDDMQPFIFINNNNSPTQKDIDKLRQDILSRKQMSLFNFPKMHFIHNFIKGDSFIFFNYYSNGRLHGILYDTKQNTTTYGFLKNDLVYKDEKDALYTFKAHFHDDKGVYSMITPNEMGMFLDYMQENKIVENLSKLEQLHNLNEDSNSFIFFYEFKDASK